MRIAYVVHDVSKVRGHDRYVAELVERFSGEHEVHVFASSCQDINPLRMVFHKVWTIRSPYLIKILSFLVSATLQLWKKKFDIVHAQGVCGLVQNVVTAHICQAAYRKIYNSARFGSVSLLRSAYHRLMMAITVSMEKRLYTSPRTKAIIAVSRKIKTELVEHYGAREELITVIYNGVDLDEFSPENAFRYRQEVREKHDIREEEFMLLFVGEFKRKGLDYAINAVSCVPDVVLVVVGEGNTGYYKTLARRLGVAERVKFIGFTREISKYYAASDAFLFPTLYEPFGLVITEAMASGLPVITSRSAGATELIEHMRDGILLNDPTDVREIAFYLSRLLGDVQFRKQIGYFARQKAEQYSWDRVARETMEVYESVMNKESQRN